jgi:hypothetical protein
MSRMFRTLVSFIEASATVAGSPGGAPARARPGTFSRTFEAFGRLPLAAWRFCMTGCITPRSSLHSCSDSLCPEIVRAGRRGSLACPASPARRTFGLPRAAAPEALGREGGDARFCVTSQVFRCLDFRSCVRGGVRVLTHGCWGSCGCITAPGVWKNGGRAREGLEPPSAGQMPGVGRRFYRTFDEGCHGALGQRFPTVEAY